MKVEEIERETDRKKTARMKVNAGMRLLMADERVGELNSKPLFPSNWHESLQKFNTIPKPISPQNLKSI